MKTRFISILLLSMALCISGCASSPQKNDQQAKSQTGSTRKSTSADAKYIAAITAAPTSEHIIMAKRFLHSFDAGGLAMNSLTKELERQAADQPGVADLTKRALADITADDFENLAARVYTRHINKAYMTELASFAESDAGSRFMRLAIDQAMSNKKASPDDITRQFSSDELIRLMKFLQSESFSAFQKEINTINAELKVEGEKLGMAMMREFVRQQ